MTGAVIITALKGLMLKTKAIAPKTQRTGTGVPYPTRMAASATVHKMKGAPVNPKAKITTAEIAANKPGFAAKAPYTAFMINLQKIGGG